MSKILTHLWRAKWLGLAMFIPLVLLGCITAAEIFTLQVSPLNWLRGLLGILFSLLCPGYALQAATFPHEHERSVPERLALAFGLSLALVPLVALGLSYLPWGVREWPLLLSLTGVTLIFGVAALIRQGRLPLEETVGLEDGQRLSAFSNKRDWLDRGLLILLSSTLALAIMVILGLMIWPRPSERFTEFYLLGSAGLSQDFPQVVTANEPFTVNVGIANHEGEAVQYTLLATVQQQVLAESTAISISDSLTQTQALELKLPSAGNDQVIELVLKRGRTLTPYRTLKLWLNVQPQILP